MLSKMSCTCTYVPVTDSFDNLSDDDAWLSLFNEDGSAGPTYDPGFPQYDIELDNGNDLDGDDDDNGDDNIDKFELRRLTTAVASSATYSS
jgi:hypothetical protein